jgi:hypothetical protein
MKVYAAFVGAGRWAREEVVRVAAIVQRSVESVTELREELLCGIVAGQVLLASCCCLLWYRQRRLQLLVQSNTKVLGSRRSSNMMSAVSKSQPQRHHLKV